MRLPIAVAILVALAVSSLAQDAANSHETGAIAGTVVDSITGQPLKEAQVFARGSPANAGGLRSLPAPTSTDANGRFAFESLTPGRYLIRASHDNYVNQGNGGMKFVSRMLSLAPGQRIAGFVISLTPEGAIAGHVSDENGKPLPSVSLEVMRNFYDESKRGINDVATATTNAAGEYRIRRLAPGKYYLRASTSLRKQTKATNNKSYVPLYYPSVPDQTRAALLEVRPGEELRGIDMTFAPVRTVRISGRIIDARTSPPSKRLEVTLLSDQGNTIFLPGKAPTDARGAFEFSGIPPGSYVVVAQSANDIHEDNSLWGQTSIEVGDLNVRNVNVVIGKGVEVRGRVSFEGKSFDISNLAVRLEPLQPSAVVALMPEIENAPVKSDGTFVFRNVPEGNYDVDLLPSPAGFYFKADGEVDVSETDITIGRDHATQPLELILSPANAWIGGKVLSDGQPGAGVVVVLVPDGKRRNQRRHYKVSVTDKFGTFLFQGVTPGDYKLFAWEEIERDAFMDPDFLRLFEDRGQAVHLEQDGQANMKLEMISKAETVP